MIGYPEDIVRVEKLEKFVRKVARIQLNDIGIICAIGRRDGIAPEMERRLKGLVREAKVLAGKVKTKKDSSP